MKIRGPKHQAIRDALLEKINSGAWPAASRIPGEVELASLFGVSRVTIARALLDLQDRGHLKRIAGSGTFVSEASASVGRHFGLLIPELGGTEIFEPICQGMMHSPQASSHSLMWGNSSIFGKTKGEQALQQCEHYIQKKVDGVFFAPVEHLEDKDDLNRRIIAMLRKANIPVVLLDRCYLPFPERSELDLVGIDNRRAGFLATEHLLDHGCKRLLFLAMKKSANTVEARISGYRDAVLRRGLTLKANRVAIVSEINERTIGELCDRFDPDGILCTNDMLAGMLMQVLDRLGKDVPEKIKLVGIDDIKYAALLRVPLTTVHQPCADIGRAALAVMLERLENPFLPRRDVLLPISLVVRRSCGHAGA
ncbi:MAG: GntR family transcriptional regulator [Acidobacteriaceae bacterium]|nr:GntR family transcriptional regulator [Acidobacteriaceae bacterium]